MLLPDIYNAAVKLWNYHHLNHSLTPSDCLIVLGSHDLRVAEEGARLYLQGYAPVIVFSGGFGNLTSKIWTVSEAEQFAAIAVKLGVPENAILIENKSTNTGENIQYSLQLMSDKGIDPQSMILVQKPYMERRTYATARMYIPLKPLLVASSAVSFDEYPNDEIPVERLVSIMVGDLERIKYYPGKGFQVYQEIPDDVWAAWEFLVDEGFNGHRMP
ncbi:MAG: YdcF family protein [Chitinophagaceae bacterium]